MYTKGLTIVNSFGTSLGMANKPISSFPRRRRMVVLPKPVDDALAKRARAQHCGMSPLIRDYIVAGLKRDGLLVAK